MDTIFLEGLIFSGHHGVGAPERARAQRIAVDIHVSHHPTDPKERIRNTYNYMDAHEIARKLIEEESYKLLETIAQKIGDRILEHPLPQEVRVTVRKLDLLSRGHTGVIVTKKKS